MIKTVYYHQRLAKMLIILSKILQIMFYFFQGERERGDETAKELGTSGSTAAAGTSRT